MDSRDMVELMEATERLEDVAEALEQAASRLESGRVAMAAQAQENVGRIVATVESVREAELERKLAEAEAKIAELHAAATAQVAAAAYAPKAGARKTLPVGVTALLAKQGVSLESSADGTAIEAGAIDAALGSLSIEQRIAVKAEMRRAGLLG